MRELSLNFMGRVLAGPAPQDSAPAREVIAELVLEDLWREEKGRPVAVKECMPAGGLRGVVSVMLIEVWRCSAMLVSLL